MANFLILFNKQKDTKKYYKRKQTVFLQPTTFIPSDGQDSEEDYDSEVPEEEIDALLEEGLPEEMKGPRKRRREALLGEGEEAPYDERQKIVLVGEEEEEAHWPKRGGGMLRKKARRRSRSDQ